jgi:ABC-type transport system involved in multi-copper enzyme maturation permease subunit
VYKRSYQPYAGPLTGTREQFVTLVRYALAAVWASRVTVVLFVLCLSPAFISLFTIYLLNNEAVRLLISGDHGGGRPLVAMDARFFFQVMSFQCWPSLTLTAWVGPRLISMDISNNGLATILSHPIERNEYILAKIAALAGLLSAVTWVPLLGLFAFQSHLSAAPWAGSHLRVAAGMFLGSWLWILLLSLMSLALASWVKWHIVATGLFFGFMFVPAGVGGVFNAVLHTDWGNLINIPFLMTSLWKHLLGTPIPPFVAEHELPLVSMLVALGAMAMVCVAALNARIRAREVVRG